MRCRACRRPLTNEISQRYGFGPECLRRAVAAGNAPLESLELMDAYKRSHKSKRIAKAKPPPVDQSTGDLFESLKSAALDDLHKAATVLQSLGVGVEIVLHES